MNKTHKTRGFVTVATGSEQYYIVAANLLKSYRYFAKEPLPFAILADQENEYTALFDDVIILENPQRSYMDKVFLLNHIPYDETLFVESDILVYKDITCFFDAFEEADDYSMFGINHPLDADLTYGLVRQPGKDWGWFDPKTMGKYQDQIHWIPKFGSDFVFMRKGPVCERASQVCLDVWANSGEYGVKPIDDDLFAVGMAVSGCKCVPSNPKFNKAIYWQMLPNGWKPEPDFHKGYCRFTRPGKQEADDAFLCHWGSRYTKNALYKREAKMLACRIAGNKLQEHIWYVLYSTYIPVSDVWHKLNANFRRITKGIKRRLRGWFIHAFSMCLLFRSFNNHGKH